MQAENSMLDSNWQTRDTLAQNIDKASKQIKRPFSFVSDVPLYATAVNEANALGRASAETAECFYGLDSQRCINGSSLLINNTQEQGSKSGNVQHVQSGHIQCSGKQASKY